MFQKDFWTSYISRFTSNKWPYSTVHQKDTLSFLNFKRRSFKGGSENKAEYFFKRKGLDGVQAEFLAYVVCILSSSMNSIMRTWVNLWDWENRQLPARLRVLGILFCVDCLEIKKWKGLPNRSNQFYFKNWRNSLSWIPRFFFNESGEICTVLLFWQQKNKEKKA
jgi:hypothetical protein